MRASLLLPLLLLLSACHPKATSTVEVPMEGSAPQTLSVVTIDGCEYFYCPCEGARIYTHKGNCKNPIHIYNVEAPAKK